MDVLRSPGQRLQYDEMYDELAGFNPLAPQARDYNGRSWRERRRQWEIPTRNNPSTPKDPWLRNMDSQDNNQRYMYTHGHSVHMNPNSEESMLETARWVNELQDWEHEWAGIGLEDWTIDPRLPASSEEVCPGDMAAEYSPNEAEQRDKGLLEFSCDSCQEDTADWSKGDGVEMKATAEEEQLLNRLEGMAAQFKSEEAKMQAETERLASRPKCMEASCKPEDVEMEAKEEKEWEKVEEETNSPSTKKALNTPAESDGRFTDSPDIGNDVLSFALFPCGGTDAENTLPRLSVVDNILSCRPAHPSDGESITNSRHEPQSATDHIATTPSDTRPGCETICSVESKEVIKSFTSERIERIERCKPEPDVFPFEPPPHITQHLQKKLAANNIHYTVNEHREEMAGILLTIWADIMETVRPGTAGVPLSAQNDPETCQHVGGWDLELYHESCRNCSLWKPILVLRCPSCSVQTCVRCRWFGGTPSAT